MQIVLMGKYKNGEEEEIDTADTFNDAMYLEQEYRMAYGPDWTIRMVIQDDTAEERSSV